MMEATLGDRIDLRAYEANLKNLFNEQERNTSL